MIMRRRRLQPRPVYSFLTITTTPISRIVVTLVALFLVIACISLYYYYDPHHSVLTKNNGMGAVFHSDDDNDDTMFRLKLVTMNIAGMELSQSAPKYSWGPREQKKALVAEILASDPDVICLQECPTRQWALEVFDHGETTYNHMGSAQSHAGFVSLLIRNGINADMLELEIDMPMVAATIAWRGQAVAVASMHLAPFEENAWRREQQIKVLLDEAMEAYAHAVILAGDTNMRDAEDATMESSLALMDAWKLAGASHEAEFSWDTMPHYSGNINGTLQWQNLYYGATTRAYRRRYDRIYIGQLQKKDANTSSLMQVHVPAFALIANQPVSKSRYHFLSDHFGIASRLELSWRISDNLD